MAHSSLSRRAFLSLWPAAPWVIAQAAFEFPIGNWGHWLDAAAWAASPRSPRVREYPRTAISTVFPVRNLSLPADYPQRIRRWRLTLDGLVRQPGVFDLQAFKAAFPKVSSINELVCVEGWSAIAEWTGARLGDVLKSVEPLASARYVVCHAADYSRELRLPFYGSLSLEDAYHPQTLLAYEMNGHPLPLAHGAPLRLRVPGQLGYKSTKFVHRIELVASLESVGRGQGGYWEDRGYSYRADL